VGVSVYGELLRYSDPQWVRKLALGAKLILVNIFSVIGLVVVGMIVGVALGVMGGLSTREGQAVIQLLAIGASVIGWVGAWLITEQDPSGVGEDKYGVERKLIRVFLLLNVLSSFVTFTFTLAAVSTAASAMGGVVSSILGLVGMIGVYAQFQYFQKLATRIPDAKLSERARMLKVWLCGGYSVFLLLSIVGGLVAAARGPAAMGRSGVFIGVGCFGGLIGLLMVVLAVMSILMIDRFRRAFNEQAVLAAQIWGMHEGETR
jgi:hypothetical protein